MKQILTILTIFSIWGKCYAQTTKVAGSTSANAPVVYTVKGADDSKKKSIDSLAVVLRAEYKKLLADSMAVLQPVKPITDAIEGLTANVKTIQNSYVTKSITDGLTNRIVQVENNGSNYNIRISNLETWKTSTMGELTTINGKIATIPAKAVSTTITTSTSTTTTELKP